MNRIDAGTAMAATLVILTLGPGTAVAEPVRYDIEPTHTFVNFEVKHFATSTVRARFDQVTGFVTLDRKAQSGKADITLHTDSISSGTPAFDKHLKSADFFNVTKTPTARFTGTDFSFDGSKLQSVAGQLTLLGKTAPVTLKATSFNCYDQPVLKVRICGGDFETSIKRSQWGMSWGIDMGVPDEVRLLIQIEAVEKRA